MLILMTGDAVRVPTISISFRKIANDISSKKINQMFDERLLSAIYHCIKPIDQLLQCIGLDSQV